MDGSTLVLVVDDDPLVRATLRHILARGGYGVVEAEDGRVGLEAFRARRPAVVLLDLRMPDLDGLEVLARITADAPNTPVIVISGHGTMGDAVQALRRGAWDFLTKPLPDSELLVQAVARALEKAALIDENRRYAEELQRTNRALARALSELRSDQEAGRRLQFQLLPPDRLEVGRFRFERRLYPSLGLSGDFVDYFPLGDARAAFYLADVAGHGAASAFVTAVLATLVAKHREAFAARNDDTLLRPAAFLASLNRDVCAQNLEKHVALFYGVLDLTASRLVYSSAGQYPYPVAVAGGRTVRLECPGTPLGLVTEGSFREGELALGAGDRLLCVSDGVLEIDPLRPLGARQDELARLLAAARTLDDMTAGLGLPGRTPLRDDAALLLVQEIGDA
jgi:serine phosphatase RsbU (regulator of sigma subunit)